MRLDKPLAVSLTEHTARALRKAILRGELKPGARVVELAIAEQMGISRGPIREAIQQLASEGLLVIHPRRGAEVRVVDPQTAWEVQTLRANLESFALRLGFHNVTDCTIHTLREYTRQMQSAVDREDLAELIDADLSFHGALVDLAEHSRLSISYHALDPLLGVVFYTGVQEAGIPISETPMRHEEIVDALQSGDLNRALQVVEHHYQIQADKYLTLTHPRH